MQRCGFVLTEGKAARCVPQWSLALQVPRNRHQSLKYDGGISLGDMRI